MSNQTPNLPADLDAEKIILGNCMAEETHEPLGDLSPLDFYSGHNAKIVEAIHFLRENKKPVNELEVLNYLKANGNHTPAKYVLSLHLEAIHVRGKLDYYQERIRETARTRALLKDASAIGEAAADGYSLIEIQEKARNLAEKTKPSSAGEPRKLYPSLPEEAWHDTAKIYRYAVGNSTEASDNYHLMSFLVATGILLGKSVYARMGRKVYPNLFAVLVGRAGGGRKDTAMDYGMEFMLDCDPDVHLAGSLDSRQGWLQSMANRQNERKQKDLFGTFRSILRLTELRSLIEAAQQKHLSGIIPELHKASDCSLPLENDVRNNPVSIKDHCVGLIAGTPPGWLKTISQTDLENGLGSRIMFVPGDPKEPMPEPPPPDSPALNVLKRKIREVIDHYRAAGTTRLSFSPKAKKRWDSFYLAHNKRVRREDELIALLSERDHTNCLKLCLIYSALDRATEISGTHLDAAIAFVEFIYEARHTLFSDYGLPFYVEQEKKITEAVRASGPGGISKRALQQRFHRIGAEVFNRRLKALIQDDGPLRIRNEGRKIYLVSN